MDFINIISTTFVSPLDLIVGILLCFSLLTFTNIISQKIIIHSNKLINFSIFYFLIIYIFSQIIFLVSLIIFNYLILKYFLYLFILLNIFFAFKYNYFHFLNENIFKFLKPLHRNRIIIFLFLLLAISLAPASDVDSLDYHLGVPIQIMRDEIYKPDLFWIHSRVIGLGEFINLIGLSIGTKNFGSIIQFSSILILIKIFLYVKECSNSKFNFYLFIFSCPLILTFLIFQKIQLLPNVGLILSIVLFLENLKLENKKFFLISIFILFMSSTFKYSFLINTFAIFSSLIFLNLVNRKIYQLIFPSLLIFSITILPLLLKNYFFFGDPLSPFFEFLKNTPNQNVVNFSKILGSDTYGDFMNFSFWTIFLFPIFLSFSNKIYFANHLLGIGILYLYYFLFNKKFYQNQKIKFLLLIIIINLFIYIFLVKQLTPRYYVDIYFILGLILILNYEKIKRQLFSKLIILLMKLEIVIILSISFFIIFFLTSASLNPNSYKKFMTKGADGYSEAIWIDEILPKNAIYLSENSRSHALFPRKFISIRQLIDDEDFDFLELVFKEKITHIVISYPTEDSHKKMRAILKHCKKYEVIGTKKVQRGVRNPFSKWRAYMDLQAIKLNCL